MEQLKPLLMVRSRVSEKFLGGGGGGGGGGGE
jgi:hypothetical protein